MLSTGVVTGVLAGSLMIRHTQPSGFVRNFPITVNPLLGIVGVSSVCQSQTIALVDGTPGGGVWSSGNTALATVSATGIVSGLSGGTAVISFTTVPGCVTTKTVTVNPSLPITGPASVCVGQTIRLSDGLIGGTWSSSNTGLATVASSGIVTGILSGASTLLIKYTMPTGCMSSFPVMVNPLLATAGPLTVCQGQKITLINGTPGGGIWNSSNPGIAQVVGSTVGGMSSGTVIITFTTIAGCITTTTLTVNPTAPITGVATTCVAHTTILSNAIAGGTWSSTNVGQATVVASTGVVTGVIISSSTLLIKYTLPTGCMNSIPFTVTGCKDGDTTTSINPMGEKEIAVNIYPNPCMTRITIEMNGAFLATLYNMLGQKIAQQNGIDKTTMNIERAPAGMYEIVLTTDNQRITRKIMKN